MQLVLKEETHIQSSGRCYQVDLIILETLTKELVEKAWALFLELIKEESQAR